MLESHLFDLLEFCRIPLIVASTCINKSRKLRIYSHTPSGIRTCDSSIREPRQWGGVLLLRGNVISLKVLLNLPSVGVPSVKAERKSLH
jgi:hypothetical protein